MTKKLKGNIGEIKVMSYLVENGYELFVPLFDNGEIDLITSKDGMLYRISVKATSSRSDSGR